VVTIEQKQHTLFGRHYGYLVQYAKGRQG